MCNYDDDGKTEGRGYGRDVRMASTWGALGKRKVCGGGRR